MQCVSHGLFTTFNPVEMTGCSVKRKILWLWTAKYHMLSSVSLTPLPITTRYLRKLRRFGRSFMDVMAMKSRPLKRYNTGRVLRCGHTNGSMESFRGQSQHAWTPQKEIEASSCYPELNTKVRTMWEARKYLRTHVDGEIKSVTLSK